MQTPNSLDIAEKHESNENFNIKNNNKFKSNDLNDIAFDKLHHSNIDGIELFNKNICNENNISKEEKKDNNKEGFGLNIGLIGNKRQREYQEVIQVVSEDKKAKHTYNSIENDPDYSGNNNINTINSFFNSNNRNSTKNIECPYLGTIKRHLLDFDFEKVCCISLSNMNVYACLICGKYYQGRGKNTYAYTHSLQEDHHLFINLNDETIICLPEGYEVLDNSLKDIKLNLKPVYSEEEIKNLDREKDLNRLYSTALDGTEYIPGCIGLNNIKKTDYVNVIIQALCRVGPVRNYFLRYDDRLTNLVS